MADSVLFVGEPGDSALRYYRRRLPGLGLMGLGWKVFDAPVLAEVGDRHQLVGFQQGADRFMRPTEVVVIRAPVDPTEREADSVDMIRAGRAAGQRVYIDLDDDVWHLPDYNPAKRHWDATGRLATFEAEMDACDGVLVSTPPLAEEVRSHISAPVHLAPNGIEVAGWPQVRRHDPLRIGWVGLLQWRWEDFALIAGALADALGRDALRHDPRGAVEFWHLGYDSTWGTIHDLLPAPWPSAVVEEEWVEFSNFGALLTNVDVALVPMVDSPVNRSRSPSTGLALAAAGVPFIASGLPAYLELAERVPGVYVVDDDHWPAGISALLDAARHDTLPTAQEMRRAVHTHYGPGATGHAWHRALTSQRLIVAR